jgi:hypothetical protein
MRQAFHMPVFACLLMAAASTASVGAPESPACKVPQPLADHLHRELPGWEVVTLAHLSPEHQRLYARDHPKGCPGVVTLDFFGDPFPAIALSLVKPRKALLVLARQRSPEGWSSQVLEDTNEPAVVWKEGHGVHTDVYGERRLSVSSEGLVWCGYESWAILYAWVDGKIEKIWISD